MFHMRLTPDDPLSPQIVPDNQNRATRLASGLEWYTQLCPVLDASVTAAVFSETKRNTDTVDHVASLHMFRS